MITEFYTINYGRCTRISRNIWEAVFPNVATRARAFVIKTRAYNRNYLVMDESLESAERVHRLLSARKLALCADCGRVVAAADRFCAFCGALQLSKCEPTYRGDVVVVDDMGSM